ncbi:MAG: LysM peptidoglycan-binding domain-containing protein, partial [Melioribacteraceae bacterium]
ITVIENETIRKIAGKYLNDSNLWEDILRVNNLTSPADIKPGTKLFIPVALIKENQESLNNAFTAINEASKAGAKLFAESLISKASNLYEDAVKKRKEGKIEESTKLAKSAKENADKAIIESQNNSKTSGTALLSFKKGNVENRKPTELVWNEAELYAKLFEQYRTRTLSNSYAEISFKDLSKIRLYENSQAVIQSSRVDLLKNQKRATVNLEKGEAYALLLGNGKKKDFNLNIPGLDTKINSKLFWVQKENKETKIANYNGEIEVTASDSMVVIGENEGSVVPDGGVPSEPKSLLPAPALRFPELEKTFYVSSVNFNWDEIPGAVKYSFNISGERNFDNLIQSNNELTNTEYKLDNLEPGIYYWRVAAVDQIGFPG